MAQHSLSIPMPTSLQRERWAPFVLAGIATLVWWYWEASIAAGIAKELLGALLSAAAVAAGFLTTALSILLPLANSPTGLKLRRSGYQQDLFRYMRSAIYSAMALAAISVIGFLKVTPESGPGPYLSAALIFAATYTAGALLRVAEILMALFERANEPDDKGG